MHDHSLADPLAVFAGILAALQNSDWKGVAELCDPVSLRLMKEGFVRSYDPDGNEPAPSPTAEDYMRFDPELPASVAEYYVQRASTARDIDAELKREFAGIQSFAELTAASPAAVFAAWLDAHSLQRQMESHVEAGELARGVLEAGAADLHFQYDFVALGHVEDGGDLAHVIYRANVPVNAADASGGTADRAGCVADPPADATAPEPQQSPQERAVQSVLWDNPPAIATLRRQPDGSWRMLASERFMTGVGGGWTFVSTLAAEPSEESSGADT